MSYFAQFKTEIQITALVLTAKIKMICDALRNLVPFLQHKKRENTHGGVLLLVKLQAYK